MPEAEKYPSGDRQKTSQFHKISVLCPNRIDSPSVLAIDLPTLVLKKGQFVAPRVPGDHRKFKVPALATKIVRCFVNLRTLGTTLV